MLNGRLPWQLHLLFKITLLNKDGGFVVYWPVRALTTICETSGNLDPIMKFVQVIKVLTAIVVKVFSMGNIIGCAHIISEIASCTKTGNRWNEQWIPNSNIDLVTWHDVNN
jgi:hypothetical protein